MEKIISCIPSSSLSLFVNFVPHCRKNCLFWAAKNGDVGILKMILPFISKKGVNLGATVYHKPFKVRKKKKKKNGKFLTLILIYI